jgi:hypothetical protein
LIHQNITTGPPTYGMAQRLMEWVALSKYDESYLLHGAETLIHYTEVIKDITHYVFTMRDLQIVGDTYALQQCPTRWISLTNSVKLCPRAFQDRTFAISYLGFYQLLIITTRVTSTT